MNQTATYTTEPKSSDIKVSPFVAMSARELFFVMLSGLGIGIFATGVMLLMDRFVFTNVLCRATASADCSSAPFYAMIVGIVVGALAGVVALAQMRVYRPLLVVMATVVTLWGFHSFTGSMTWYIALASVSVLFALLFGLYAWIARIRSFMIALILTVLIVVGLRWLLIV